MYEMPGQRREGASLLIVAQMTRIGRECSINGYYGEGEEEEEEEAAAVVLLHLTTSLSIP